MLCDPLACEGHARQVERVLRRSDMEPLIAERVASCDLMMALVSAGFALGLTGAPRPAASQVWSRVPWRAAAENRIYEAYLCVPGQPESRP